MTKIIKSLLFWKLILNVYDGRRGGEICNLIVGELCLLSPPPTKVRISLPRHDLLGKERWQISQRRGARSLFLNGLLLGSVCTGIQVKLISHGQAVRIKQSIMFKEL